MRNLLFLFFLSCNFIYMTEQYSDMLLYSAALGYKDKIKKTIASAILKKIYIILLIIFTFEYITNI